MILYCVIFVVVILFGVYNFFKRGKEVVDDEYFIVIK